MINSGNCTWMVTELPWEGGEYPTAGGIQRLDLLPAKGGRLA